MTIAIYTSTNRKGYNLFHRYLFKHTILSYLYYLTNIRVKINLIFTCIAPVSSDFENFLIHSLALCLCFYDFPVWINYVFFYWIVIIFFCCLQFILLGISEDYRLVFLANYYHRSLQDSFFCFLYSFRPSYYYV